ncbi:MAG: energy-coupling factor transporter transmembrane component T [Pyramidobacter sp.]|uniref:energy-coupling factor transporter transmembrane component T family protein n=1 Tax=Pyramidobacter sp. TaxID=1943581 RepID=UPI002A7EC401|nr:energy-coupling factor transporter transmembrane component T [Pyramidobacter sp.]MDY4031702.1 energy-coupling factor transporter transmembrane component T [Pyramidobacter sp.]
MRLDTGGLFAENARAPLDAFDPRARLLCAAAYAVTLSALDRPAALAVAALLPGTLLFCGPLRPLLRSLRQLNLVSLAMTFLLALTWPGRTLWGPFSREGIRQGLLITVRLNLISIALLRLIAAMGPARCETALARLGCPEKLRVLLLLTLRGIYLLAERMATALQAVNLRSGSRGAGRSPYLKGTLRWRVFAFMAASALLQSSDRSERMMLALNCRGGLAGFAAAQPLRWKTRDTALAVFCAVVLAAAQAFDFSGGFQ